MKGKKRFAGLMIAGALLVASPFSAGAKGLEKKQDFDYVALGDSLAAGVTPWPNSDGTIVIKDGYPEYLVKRFEQSQYKMKYYEISYPGWKTTNIIEQLKNSNVQDAIADAELITIDIGANDLLPLVEDIQKGNLSSKGVKEIINGVHTNLSKILQEIDELNKNENIKVYVMGYYNPFPNSPELLPLLDSVNQTIEMAAFQNDDIFVPTQKLIEKHEQTYLPNSKNIHLSEEGYQIVAKEFWKTIMKNR